MMGNAAAAGELAGIDELDELYKLDASESEPDEDEDDEDDDDGEDDDDDGEDDDGEDEDEDDGGEGVKPDDMPHP